MDLMYCSTRGSCGHVTASSAILKGLADDGGLYVPEVIPKLQVPVNKLSGMSYREIAFEVMRLFFTDYTDDELKSCIDGAYDDKFDTEEITPLHAAGDVYYLELFHGATAAFKDMALSILPYLMRTAAVKNHETREIVILTATSGDTGKAALAGFADVPGTRIIVFYPKDGVSTIQERQMVTQKGENTCVIGIKGNFDDAQAGVKQLFSDRELAEELSEEGFILSSANSINIGRLVPQIVYYVYAYSRLLKENRIRAQQPVNVVVPTGNFGNILAAFYAKQMGLPIGKLICASNENKVLYDFFKTGIYDRNREFVLTSSPSMDILVSSNLERLIYYLAGSDAGKNAALMEELASTGKYTLTEDMFHAMSDFAAGYSTEEQTFEEIRRVYKTYGYVIDPHTAVASGVCHRMYEKDGSGIPSIIASTASPYKFAASVMSAIDQKYSGISDLSLIDTLHDLSGVTVPQAIEQIRNAPVIHDKVIEKSEMRKNVIQYLRQTV